jgi:hypothetical protein
MERETRFELATLALARRCSTTELLPLVAVLSIPGAQNQVKPLGPHSGPKPKPARYLPQPTQASDPSLPAQSPRPACTGCGSQSMPPRDYA